MTPNGSSPAFPFTADVAFQAGDIVFATDRFGCVVYWNKEAEAISGYKVEEVLGKPYALACRMEPDVASFDLSAILAGRDFAGGVRCRSRSGGAVALYLFATAGRNPAGDPAGVVFVGRDVTGLWQAEEAAQASADKYRVLFESTLDSVAIADMDGRVLEVNPACLRMYGYTADDVKGMKLADVVAPEDRSAAAKAMASLASSRLVARTIRVLRKDGTRFVADLTASVMTIGGERRIMSVTRDVTERVRAEQARSQSERMYRAVFESANDAVLIESVDGRILDVNRNGCELLGYTKRELVKMSVSDLVPSEARAWLPRVTDAIFRDGTFRTEAVRVHKDGHHIPVEISASTMELDGRTVVLAIVRDITERKRAEAALAESESRYRALFNDSLTGIYRATPDGQILLANPALVRMLGCDSFAQLAERNLETDGSGPEFKRGEFKRRIERDGRVVGLEASWQTRDGRTLFVRENACAVRGADGAVLYYDGTVEDITDRRAAEQALRESEEKYRSVVERASDGICVVQDGRLRYLNRRLAEMAGYAPEELVGRQFMEFLHPKDRVTAVDRYRRRLAGENPPSTYTVRFLRRDGEAVPVEVNAATATYGGAPAEIVLVRDISERERLARAAEETADELRAVLDNSPGAIAGECEGVLVYANQRFARLFGYESSADVIGRPSGDFDAPQDRELLAQYSRLRERGGDAPDSYTFHGQKRDGTIAPMEASVSTYWSLGRLHILAFIREVQPGRGAP